MTWSRTARRAAKFERQPQTQLFDVRCPHVLGVFRPKHPDRPHNGRLVRAGWPCMLRPGHDGEHRTHEGRVWV